MKRYAYICSPYAGTGEEIKRNKQYARKLTRAAIEKGFCPITPHLYITESLNDKIPDERKLGLSVAIELLRKCDALIIGCDLSISDGMSSEIQFAVENGISILVAYEKNGLITKSIEIIDITPCYFAKKLIGRIERVYL